MLVKDLKLTNFRNHKNFRIGFGENINVIVGPNASGKTNILEATHMLSTGRSFKAKYDRDVIRHNEDYARVEGKIHNGDEDKELEMFVQKNPNFENASIKKAKVNKVPKALYAFTGLLNTVLFSPEDIEVLTGSPAGRRKYMDLILYQIDPNYKHTHTEYLQAVRQRNKVLENIRNIGRGSDQLGFWNTKIVRNGIYIQEQREILATFLQKQVRFYGKELNDYDTEIVLNYHKSEISFDRLHEYLSREIAAKSTLIGPHREDFEFMLDDFDIIQFGSRGQQRAAVLALKLAEIDYFIEKTENRPVLLLDDVFSELDAKHEEALMETIQLQQTIITCTEKPTDTIQKTAEIHLLQSDALKEDDAPFV